jgi:hypothetical protein
MAVPSPAVPATTVKQANNTGQYVRVTVTGGTLTQVNVYDQATSQISGLSGTAAGTYLVPPGCSISITYSAAPTWAWTNPDDASDYPPVYAAPNLLTAQASPNNLLQQLPGNVWAPSRSVAGGTGCWSGTTSSTGLGVGVTN